MSTVATPVDEQALKDAISRIRDDGLGADRIAWMSLGHVDDNPNVIDIIGKRCEVYIRLEALNSCRMEGFLISWYPYLIINILRVYEILN